MSKAEKIQLWEELLSTQAASGLNKKDFCAAHQLSLGTFYYWQKRLRSSESSVSEGFQRLQPSVEHRLRVCLPAVSIVLESDSPETLAAVILSLSHA